MDSDLNLLTPAMKQYKEFKKKYPDCIILFRMGDFYESFYEDAKTVSKVLDITLTSRGKGDKKAPLAGIPYHSLNQHLGKLIKKGYKIALAEQIEDPKTVKGRLVKRDVVKIITPGTVTDADFLEEKKNNYISSIFIRENPSIASADVSTGEFFILELDSKEDLLNELTRINPKEIIIPFSLKVDNELIQFLKDNNYYVNYLDDEYFSKEISLELIKEVFKTETLISFGINNETTLRCIGSLIKYFKENYIQLNSITQIKKINPKETMVLDYITLRNLEIFENQYEKDNTRTLFSILDKCQTSMGSRLLRKILERPLTNKERINQRLDAVEELTKEKLSREEIKESLSNIKDIERISTKLSLGTINPRELISLKNSLKEIPKISSNLENKNSELLKLIYNNLTQKQTLKETVSLIEESIKEEPSIKISDGNIIKSSYDQELKELRNIRDNSKKIILDLEERERKRTGISTLKIGYNKIFGYYIQVSEGKLNQIPEDYIQRQTLVNGARFVTKELKELEEKLLNAEERILSIEQRIYQEIISKLKQKVQAIKLICNDIALLDVLQSFAEISVLNRYTKPKINTEKYLHIKQGRHPVVEQFSETFIPNDTTLKPSEMIILTGPNMAGKSTYLRQVCLIVILAQSGCFVPAEEADISITDRIFTRVGASDNLTKNQSTFMVEMSETANILNNATSDSLIVLDEVGRGTSTYDGVSLAWSIAEYIYKYIKAKTIFATHYHVLNKLAEEYENIKNYQMLVKENQDDIIFLRKIVSGGTDKSYGIHVAKLAGIPKSVVERAKEIQEKLLQEDEIKKRIKGKQEEKQKTIFDY